MKKLFFVISITLICFYYSKLSAQWQQTTFTSNQDYCSAIITNGSYIYAGTGNGKIYKSTDDGDNWENVLDLVNTDNISKIYTIGINNANVYIGTDEGIYLSRDYGTSWQEAISINKIVYSLAINGSNIFAGTSQGLYLSTNNGISWKRIENKLEDTQIFSVGINETGMFAGVRGYSSFIEDGIFLSKDNGISWDSLLSLDNRVLNIKISGTNIFAGTEKGDAYLSNDNGSSWSDVNAGIFYSMVYSVAINGSNIFAATQSGDVYVSTDFGKTWGMESNNLIFNKVTSLALSDKYILVGTSAKGIWKRSINDLLSKITSVERNFSEDIPSDFRLLQNYPNPFNPTTKIQFSIPKDSHVRLVIYNSLGQEIETLINKKLSPASYTVNYNASKLPSGIYFYKLQSTEYSSTKKMVLIK